MAAKRTRFHRKRFRSRADRRHDISDSWYTLTVRCIGRRRLEPWAIKSSPFKTWSTSEHTEARQCVRSPMWRSWATSMKTGPPLHLPLGRLRANVHVCRPVCYGIIDHQRDKPDGFPWKWTKLSAVPSFIIWRGKRLKFQSHSWGRG